MESRWPTGKPRILGVMSDSHGNLPRTRQANRIFDRMGIDVLLHCGDIGSAAVPTLLNSWPTHYVFGNTDYRQNELRAAIEAVGATCHDRWGELTVSDRRIAFLHGDDIRRLRATISAGEFDLVCHGHTHQFSQYFQGAMLVLNPGALHRAAIPSVAVVDLTTMEVTHLPMA